MCELDEIIALHRHGELEAAGLAYLSHLKKYPADANAWHMYGVLQAELGHYTDAKLSLEEAIRLNAEEPTFQLHLANVYKAMLDYPAAERLLKNMIEKFPSFAASYNNLGTVYFALQQWQEAATACQQAIDHQADYVDAYFNLGLALIKLNRIEKAIVVFEALLNLSEHHPGGLFQLGCLQMRKHDYAKAISYFEKLLMRFPNHAESLVNLATCYLKLGKLAIAKQKYLEALSLSPQDTQILYNLGVVNMSEHRIQEAINYYLQVVAINPDDVHAQQNLGAAYLVTNDRAGALLHFREVARLLPQDEAIAHTIKILNGDETLSSSPPGYIQALFDSYADHFDEHVAGMLDYQVPQLMYDCLAAQYDLSRMKWQVLDLGCGTGLVGELFKSSAMNLTGIDLSEKMLEVAAQKGCYDALIQGDIIPYLLDHPFTYDLILAGDVVVYYGDLSSLFAAVKSALKQGGLFVFNVEKGTDKSYVMKMGRFQHQLSYLKEIIEENGFQVIVLNEIRIRSQNFQDVTGYLCILKR